MTIRLLIKNLERETNNDVLRVRIINKNGLQIAEAFIIKSGQQAECLVHPGQQLSVEHGHREKDRRKP